MNKLKASNAITISTAIIVMAIVFWLLNTRRASDRLDEGLQEARLKSEELLSEKLLLEKEIAKMKDVLATLANKNSGLAELAKQTEEKRQHQEADFNRMKKENITLGQIKKQHGELILLQTELENEIVGLKELHHYLHGRNNELTGTVALLEEQNRMLTDELNKATMASLERPLIRAIRGKNEKQTVNAGRTKTLMANFECPAELKNLTVRIINPHGDTLSPADGSVEFQTTPVEITPTAFLLPEGGTLKNQTIDMVYTPKRKLRGGTYTIEILNKNLYVGSLKVRLN